MEDLSTRLRRIRKEFDKTQAELAVIAEVSQSNYSKYERGLVEPPYSFLTRIAFAFPVHTRWLLTGEGPMFRQTATGGQVSSPEAGQEGQGLTKQPQAKPLSVKTLAPPLESEQLSRIELGSQIAAGLPLEAHHEGYVDIPTSILSGYPANQFCALPVNGDSMEPLIACGALALVRCCENWFAANGFVAAVMIEGEITLKLVKYEKTLKVYALHPFNHRYSTIYITKDMHDARLVGVLHATIQYWNKRR